MATNSTMMPIPPIHWLRLRQSSKAGGSSSGVRVAAPVVVKPAMELKKASTGPMRPESTNGRVPTSTTPPPACDHHEEQALPRNVVARSSARGVVEGGAHGQGDHAWRPEDPSLLRSLQQRVGSWDEHHCAPYADKHRQRVQDHPQVQNMHSGPPLMLRWFLLSPLLMPSFTCPEPRPKGLPFMISSPTTMVSH